jgi:CHAT domain-containing protein
MVVFNACQTGRLGHQLTSLGGFAEAFLSVGAAAFVSSLWSVGDVPARTFTESLYAALLDGATVSEATGQARAKARAAGDATWLAYVFYAHPRARLTVWR